MHLSNLSSDQKNPVNARCGKRQMSERRCSGWYDRPQYHQTMVFDNQNGNHKPTLRSPLLFRHRQHVCNSCLNTQTLIFTVASIAATFPVRAGSDGTHTNYWTWLDNTAPVSVGPRKNRMTLKTRNWSIKPLHSGVIDIGFNSVFSINQRGDRVRYTSVPRFSNKVTLEENYWQMEVQVLDD